MYKAKGWGFVDLEGEARQHTTGAQFENALI